MPASVPVTTESWSARHPYLEALARFQGTIDAVIADLPRPAPRIPDWDDYLDELVQGIPVLSSNSVTVDLEPAGRLNAELIDRLAARPLPGALAADIAALRDELHRDVMTPGRLAHWLIGAEPFVPQHPGLLRNLGWRAAAVYLAPVTASFEVWRGDDERWLRRYCPLCGSSPAMAQLVGIDPGRRRFLCCGCCGTRWRYRRTECPFCESDPHHLASLTLDGDAGLRIDWCEACKAYLKTYAGEGHERLLLSDWSSLHLDILALDRGWVRAAASLYEPPGTVRG